MIHGVAERVWPALTVLNGDAAAMLRTIPDETVQCCVTSPPYWQLRDYGVEGQIGLEDSLEEFIDRLVAVFREVRRVLRKDGVAWVNMGDSYASNQSAGDRVTQYSPKQVSNAGKVGGAQRVPEGLKNKDLVGQPWRVAFALQSDGCADLKAVRQLERVRSELLAAYGDESIPDRVLAVLDRLSAEYAEAKGTSWYLRQDIIWSKPAPMPESTRDRCTKAHEYLFLLSRSPRYFWDPEGNKEKVTGNAKPRSAAKRVGNWGVGDQPRTARELAVEGVHQKTVSQTRPAGVTPKSAPAGSGVKSNASFNAALTDLVEFRNRRSVWEVAAQPCPDAHFATFPEELVRRCVLPSTRPGDIVLDPFGGSGTTGKVALELGRRAILVELNPKYVEIIERRTQTTLGLPLESGGAR